jgi:two-component system CheB/CheR fusion protein
MAELRDVNEHLLIAGLREQELAAALEAERAQLAVILAGIGDAVLVVDEAGTPVRTNAAYARMTGGAEAPLVPEDAQGRPLPPAQTPQSRAARGETFSLEFTLPAADGSRCWYEANGQPLHNGGAGHAAVVIRDITLSSQHRRLQDEFLALASNELRTPLTSIQGYLGLLQPLLQRRGADQHLALYAATAQHHVRRLVALVGDFVDVTRLQSGKLTLDPAPLEVGALAAQAVETARGLEQAQEQTHSLTLDAPAEPLWVRGDAGRLEQVLLNLLTNALKYTPPTSQIAVRLRRVGGEVARWRGGEVARWRWRCKIMDRASRPIRCHTCSRAPIRWRAPSARRGAAWAWGCSSATSWSRRTAAALRCNPPKGSGRRSRCGCRCWMRRAPRSMTSPRATE